MEEKVLVRVEVECVVGGKSVVAPGPNGSYNETSRGFPSTSQDWGEPGQPGKPLALIKPERPEHKLH